MFQRERVQGISVFAEGQALDPPPNLTLILPPGSYLFSILAVASNNFSISLYDSLSFINATNLAG